MDGGAWKTAIHGVSEGRARLSDFIFTFHFPALEKEMATHSSVLSWRIPGMGEPGGLPSGVAQSRTRLKWLSRYSLEWLKVKSFEIIYIRIKYICKAYTYFNLFTERNDYVWIKKKKKSCSIMSDSLWPYGLYSWPGFSVHGILQEYWSR